ncbi:protein of unknown function [Tenacibaculum soleae]
MLTLSILISSRLRQPEFISGSHINWLFFKMRFLNKFGMILHKFTRYYFAKRVSKIYSK